MVLREGDRCRAVRTVADLRSAVKPIDSPESALAYSELLRCFEIASSEVPGRLLVSESVGGFGVLWRGLALPTVEASGDGSFVVLRAVRAGGAAAPPEEGPSRQLIVRERIGRRGEFAFEIVEDSFEPLAGQGR